MNIWPKRYARLEFRLPPFWGGAQQTLARRPGRSVGAVQWIVSNPKLLVVHAGEFQKEVQNAVSNHLILRHPHILGQIVSDHSTGQKQQRY